MSKLENLKKRSRMLRALREFFCDHDFFEVETGVRIPAPAPEEYIEAVSAEGGFLRTSPELALKRLLADGGERFFELGKAFRSGEYGRKHREEFTILEYYAAHWDYRRLANFTAELFAAAARAVCGSATVDFRGSRVDLGRAEFVTVDEAYRRYAGVSAFEADARGDFDELMVTKVEPELGKKVLTFLIDYPAARASLSRLSAADSRVAERWEVYVSGLELGNAFGELVDAAEQKRRFAEAYKFRAGQGMKAYPEPTDFYAALERGIPESSGCAVGVDRLAMILCDAEDIGDVRYPD